MSTGEQAPLQRAESRLGAWSQLADAVAVEAMASAGYDWVGVDRQHGLIGVSAMVGMLQALAISATPSYVRTGSRATAEIMQALDAGATGIIVPDVEDASQAARAVAACRYPPDGIRSWGPTRAVLGSEAYTSDGANHRVECFVMLETPGALARAEEIAGTPGLTGLFVGPVDLSLSCSGTVTTGYDSPEALARLEGLAGVCHEAGIVAGVYAGSQANSVIALELGFEFVAVQSDIGALVSSSRRTLRSLRPRRPDRDKVSELAAHPSGEGKP